MGKRHHNGIIGLIVGAIFAALAIYQAARAIRRAIRAVRGAAGK